MIEVLRALQVMFVCAWGVPLYLFAEYAVRKANNPHDTLRAATWFVALSVIAFPLKWFIFGAAIYGMPRIELAVWSSLYVMGALAALFVTHAVCEVCRGR